MQSDGAYVEQIPLGIKPPASSPPVLRIVPNTTPGVQRPPSPGLYVQVASVANQEQALRAGLDLAQRLGANRPAFIRGETSIVDGQRRILMFAGPFADEPAAKRFCALAIPGQACPGRRFPGPQPRPALTLPPKNGPMTAGPEGKETNSRASQSNGENAVKDRGPASPG